MAEYRSRAPFLWCLLGLTIGAVAAVGAIPTYSTAPAAAAAPEPTTSTTEAPPLAGYSEGPDHNPCAYPDDCQAGHTLIVRECGPTIIEPAMDKGPSTWGLSAYFQHDTADDNCLGYTRAYWDSTDGLHTCAFTYTIYQNGAIVPHTRSEISSGLFYFESDNPDNIVFEFIRRCTADEGTDVLSTEMHHFYRSAS